MLPSPDIWGGIECTVNRIGDDYLDQIKASGHAQRPKDLARFAKLGIKTLRMPFLWERMAPDDPRHIDWRGADQFVEAADQHGLNIIAGFLHHGSGPRYTQLLDLDMPAKLGDFAHQFATRYSWIKAYTPVNEPLTTARFSGLYGFWYPHQRDERAFLEMTINQCRAITAAMTAVRAAVPNATLIQTEDLGRIFSTPYMAYQAEFENARRWLSLDLLCHRFGPEHLFWRRCVELGIPEDYLTSLPSMTRPDVIGVNHYITSNRFLDERSERYPARCHGTNGRHRYADIEAVRVGAENVAGHKEILYEVWDRYRRPLALTEVHLGCSREEQLRWFMEAWEASKALRAKGIDVRAVTAWSLLGAFDWDSLVTKQQGHYESGVFDLRAEAPRPTALATMIKDLTSSGAYDHPVLDVGGWWRRSDRLLYPPVGFGNVTPRLNVELAAKPATREILITGGQGLLATAFAQTCERRGLAYRLTGRCDVDLSDRKAVELFLKRHQPWAVINAAGFCCVDGAETSLDACIRDNVTAPAILAAICGALGIPLVTFSSDLVFDGAQKDPYTESSIARPINVYGHSKAKAEELVLKINADVLMVRTSAFFGPWDEKNFLTHALRRLSNGQNFVAASDQVVSPTYTPDLAGTCLDLLIDQEKGIWHLANEGAASWAEFVRSGAKRLGVSVERLIGSPTAALAQVARRPNFSVLGTQRGRLLPTLDHALTRYGNECRVKVC